VNFEEEGIVAEVPVIGAGKVRSGKEKVWRSRIVLVSNLDEDVRSDDIFEAFYSCGRILHAIQWLYGKGPRGKFKGKGFVTFLQYESAEKALALSGTLVRGRRMIVEMEKYTALRTRLVYVTNLPRQTREHERALRKLFEPVGEIKSLSWVYDERVYCGDFVGYVLIEFHREVMAADCDELVDQLVGGCNIQLSYYWLSNKHPQR
jgi:RNA recognition motif-containing protein